ncbi:MAG TPA: PDZ domain-containing protein [Bacillota bacterium]
MSELLAFPWADIARLIFTALPAVLLSPSHALLFWLIVVLVGVQYRRLAETERALYARAGTSTWRRTLLATAHGLVGGVAASFLLVFTGVALGDRDIAYLWPVALVLMLLHPRFICFSYAATLVGLAHLLFGWPSVNVPGIVGLVAILHVVEGLLVWLGGDAAALPIYVRHRDGRVVGGFSVQRFWPVPLAALLAVALPPELRGESIAMPEWWPLVAAPAAAAGPDGPHLLLWPVAAALGYGDIAVSRDPQERSRQAAGMLLLYSGTLLALAIAASHWRPLLWVAVLASGGLHEWMIQAGLRGEFGGKPRYVAPKHGVLVMEVFPGGFGQALGLRRGDVIVAVNGRPVANRQAFEAALGEAGFYLELEIERAGRRQVTSTRRFRYQPGALGCVLAPEPGDEPQVQVGGGGLLVRWVQRLIAGAGGRRSER